jgi:hypothetical protein
MAIVLIALLVWILLSLAGSVMIGKSIKAMDERERSQRHLVAISVTD